MITNKKRAIQKTSGLKTAPEGFHRTKADRRASALAIARGHRPGCTCGNHPVT